MPLTRIWSDSRLKEISIESKNVQIGVRMRKIWLSKVEGLKVCRATQLRQILHNNIPKSRKFEAQPRNSMQAPRNCAKLMQ